MTTLTFQVLEGIDKGRVFRSLSLPVTIGREEGNSLRLNDERISRFHAKVQKDAEDLILTDLDSTNGTRVNGNPIQIRRLRPGDQIGVGRTTLLYGTLEEIADRRKSLAGPKAASIPQVKTVAGVDVAGDLDFDLNVDDQPETPEWVPNEKELPPLPKKMSPAQAARLAEIFDHLHRGLSNAMERIRADEDASHVTLPYAEWQKVQAVQLFLARYLRGVAEPDLIPE